MTININKKLRKELKKQTISIEKRLGYRDIAIGLTIIIADIIHDGIAITNKWQFQPGFGDRQWLFLIIGFICVGFGIYGVCKHDKNN